MSELCSQVKAVVDQIHFGQRVVLGLDGLSRSGKTTLCEALADAWRLEGKDICVVHMDDLIVDRQRRYGTGFAEWYEYYGLQWDVTYLRDYLFSRLKRSAQITLPFYDDALDHHVMRTMQLPERGIVLVEGVFLQRPQWRQFLDFCVYVECPRGTRFAREHVDAQRKIAKFEHRYWKAEDYYLDTVCPAQLADLVVQASL